LRGALLQPLLGVLEIFQVGFLLWGELFLGLAGELLLLLLQLGLQLLLLLQDAVRLAGHFQGAAPGLEIVQQARQTAVHLFLAAPGLRQRLPGSGRVRPLLRVLPVALGLGSLLRGLLLLGLRFLVQTLGLIVLACPLTLIARFTGSLLGSGGALV